MTVLSDRVDALEATNSTLVNILNGLKGTLQGAIDAGQGPQGWSPVLKVTSDGDRRVLEIIDWAHGQTGYSKPVTLGFIGLSGIVATAAEAIDIRGGGGKSAYQTWLDLGNAGDEQAFLDDISTQAVSATAANKIAAQAAQAASETAQTASETAQTASETARDKAQEWSSKAEGLEVEPGFYSALHHASQASSDATAAANARTGSETARDASVVAKTAAETARDASIAARILSEAARDAAEDSQIDADNARILSENARDASVTAKTAAETAQTSAQTAQSLAQDWSSKAENVEVEPGFYSALHHAAKAAASALSASSDLAEVQAVKTAVETIFDSFDDRYLGAYSTANEPLTDNDGQPLQVGAMYLNSDTEDLMFWTGARWSSPEAAAEAAAAAALASQNAAAASETNAAASEVKAQKWAEEAEGIEVEAGKYSAKHHAEQAKDHADTASLASNSEKWTLNEAVIEGSLRWSPTNHITYRAKSSHTTTADPATDTGEVNWKPIADGLPIWDEVQNKPVNFPPSAHGHAISDVANLQTELDGKAQTGHGHSVSDVTGLQTALDGKSNTDHGHTVSDVTGLQSELDGKALASHTHAISEVTGLQTALNAKANSSHTHTKSEISDFNEADYATAAQGSKADSAVQPVDLQPVATSGDYNDLINKPKIINPIAIAIALGS